jgi:hypothetical protein
MAIVDFEQILKITTDKALPISANSGALGPILSGGGRDTLYDPVWGYFLFAQGLRTEYGDQDTYFDGADFTIHGIFTLNAAHATNNTGMIGESDNFGLDELANNFTLADWSSGFSLSSPATGAGLLPSELSDDQKFNICIAEMNSLELLFRTAAKATAPTDYNDWGTATDPRCIPLPLPLLDKAGQRIYALATSFDVEPGQWGNYIRYKAILREAKFPPGKVLVNDKIIDDGVITITLPAPLLSRTPLAGCAGEVLQVRNYTKAVIEVSGTCSGPPPTGNRTIADLAHDLMTSLNADKVDIGVGRINGPTLTKDVLWPKASLDEGSGIDVNYEDQTCVVTIRAKPVKV